MIRKTRGLTGLPIETEALLLGFITAVLLWSGRQKLHFDPAVYSSSFADRSLHFGMPNFGNVFSNIGFLILGIYGLSRLGKLPKVYRNLGAIFSFAILGTSFGSAYFHWDPSPTRLFWDQLPMSIAFASFVGMLVVDRVGVRSGNVLGTLLCLLGPLSVWNIYYGNGATEYYLSLQFGTILFVALLLAITRPHQMKTSLLVFGLGAYILAKIFEAEDATIFAHLGIISGHSLKHIAAACSLLAILRGTEV